MHLYNSKAEFCSWLPGKYLPDTTDKAIMSDVSSTDNNDKEVDDNFLPPDSKPEDNGVMPFQLEFNSKAELVTVLQVYAERLGFVLPMKRSQERNVVLHCNCGGKYWGITKQSQKGQQKSGTKKAGCPYLVFGSFDRVRNKWVARVKCGKHNHPLDPLTRHSFFCCNAMTLAVWGDIKQMLKASIEPQQILSALQIKYINTPFTPQDIYNLKAKLHCGVLHGKTAIQLLIQQYGESLDWICNYSLDKDTITGIFISHSNCIMLGKLYHLVFLMDCTYKTNRYGMPLMVIVGVTAINTTFIAAYVFLTSKVTSSYHLGIGTTPALVQWGALGCYNQQRVGIDQCP